MAQGTIHPARPAASPKAVAKPPVVKKGRAHRVDRILSGPVVLKSVVRSRLDLVPILREGLPFRALTEVSKHLHVSIDDFAQSIALPRRTLARRKKQGRLDPSESERVLRVADIAALAADVFGDEPSLRWLNEPNRALGGASPLSLLDTDVGAEAVRDVLGRIEHGIYS